jgi:uncharacterized protein (TIGR02231 family)
MKHFFTLILVLTCYFFAHAIEDPKPVKSTIKEVTVFLQGAQISRTGQVTVPAGTSYLIFEGLPQDIMTQTIQVSGKGDFTILNVVHQINYLNGQKKTKEIMMLEDSLENLNNQITEQSTMLGVYTDEEAMLLANKAIGGQQQGVKIADLKEATEYYRTRLTDIRLKKIKQDQLIKKLQEKITIINNQLIQLNALKNIPTSEIIIGVTAKSPSTGTLTVTYALMNAGWTPSYDLRATDVNNPIKLAYKANVYQSTGEDWNDIRLTLSTGNPQESGAKPILNPWYLNFYNPVSYDYEYDKKAKGDYKEEAKPETSTVNEIAVSDENAAGSMANYTTMTESTTTFEFEIEIPYSIPADGKYYNVQIREISLPAIYEYYAAPKLDKDAFLMARVTGWEEYNLLSGNINLYFEGTYVGVSYIDVNNTKDTIDFSLGRDKNIVVTRNRMKDFMSKKMIGLNQTETYAFEIEIKNKKKQNVKIVIEDQFPISQNKDIEVERMELSGGTYDEDTGKLSWKLDLKPAETKKLKMMYSVKYPKNQRVILE